MDFSRDARQLGAALNLKIHTSLAPDTHITNLLWDLYSFNARILWLQVGPGHSLETQSCVTMSSPPRDSSSVPIMVSL